MSLPYRSPWRINQVLLLVWLNAIRFEKIVKG
jgi:hypothetical protein